MLRACGLTTATNLNAKWQVRFKSPLPLRYNMFPFNPSKETTKWPKSGVICLPAQPHNHGAKGPTRRQKVIYPVLVAAVGSQTDPLNPRWWWYLLWPLEPRYLWYNYLLILVLMTLRIYRFKTQGNFLLNDSLVGMFSFMLYVPVVLNSTVDDQEISFLIALMMATRRGLRSVTVRLLTVDWLQWHNDLDRLRLWGTAAKLTKKNKKNSLLISGVGRWQILIFTKWNLCWGYSTCKD